MVQTLANEIVNSLIKKGLTLSLAESCTGGMASQYITAIDGCSIAFLGGVVSYSNAMKHNVLGVGSDLLDRYGAVSEQVSVAMANGMRSVAKTSIAGSITGIAGSGGGTPEKPVGTVHIAVSTADETIHKLLALDGDRDSVRQQTVKQLFILLKETIDKL